MKDTEKYEALILIAQLLSLGKPPTLRETGIQGKTLQVLSDDKFLKLVTRGAEQYPDELDRFVIFELTTAAKAWCLKHEKEQEVRAATLPGQFRSGWRSKLLELLWGIGGLIVGAIVGWHLHRVFGGE